MRTDFRSAIPSGRRGTVSGLITAGALLAAVSAVAAAPESARRDRPGDEVVRAVCVNCHGPGAHGAPRIGDPAAWIKRASQGLSALTEHALTGIRAMPAHGGSPDVTDLEIQRAIVHMVNASGGHWVEPAPVASGAPRSAEQIVQMQCSQCHEPGLNGAPKIGDRAAWIPRMRNGLDAVVAKAVHGHGPMPARGGMPDLSEPEIRSAVVYMFNGGMATPQPQAQPRLDPLHRMVAGTDVYLGIMAAETIRAAKAEGRTVGAVAAKAPRGKGYVHLNISLLDNGTKAAIKDAVVKLKVTDPMGAQTKTLEAVADNGSVSYGNYFRVPGLRPYAVIAEIHRPGVASPIEARFDIK